MIQPRKRSLWVWKLGSVKATAKACKRASSDGMIDHTGGGSWLLGECQRHGFNLKYTEVLPQFPSLEICESSDAVVPENREVQILAIGVKERNRLIIGGEEVQL